MADKLISFSEIVEKFDDCCGECGCCIHHLPDHSERNTHCLILNSLKAVDAVPVVHGRWELGVPVTCSACGKPAAEHDSPISFWKSPYCPWCGAKMDLKEE